MRKCVLNNDLSSSASFNFYRFAHVVEQATWALLSLEVACLAVTAGVAAFCCSSGVVV